MPIEETGTISLKDDIGPEVGDTGSVSLVNCSNLSNPSLDPLPTGMRDFAGHRQVTPPNAPTDATVSNRVLEGRLGERVISISWTQNSNNETGFRIENSINDGAWAFVKNVGANVTNTVDEIFLPEGGSYRFRVRAYNSSGHSAWAVSNFILIAATQQQQQQQQAILQQAIVQQAIQEGIIACIAIDTEVMMSDGTLRTLKEVQLGDEVMSVNIPGLTEQFRNWKGDLKDIKKTSAKVIFKSVYNEERYIIINEKLKMTPNAEYILVKPKRKRKWQFLTADRLSVGDWLLDDGFKSVKIVSLEYKEEGIDVAHINVESDDLFFGNGLVIHNVEDEIKIQR